MQKDTTIRVLALTRYERIGSSSRVRFCQYFPYLETHGVEIVSAPFFSDEYVTSLSGQTISKLNVLRDYIKQLFSAFDLLWVE